MLNLVVVFDSKGLEKYGVFKNALEQELGRELVKAHNEFARIGNEDNFYERYNKEFEESGKDQKDYIGFLNEKGQYILDKLNNDVEFNKFLNYEFDDEHQLLGTWKQDGSVTISFYLKEEESE